MAWRRAAFALFAVGWGANHFTALLPIYRRALGLPDTALTAIFGVYLFGLAPGLLLGGPLSDRYGRRPVLLVSVGLSLAGSLTLIAGTPGAVGAVALYAGRLLTGVAAGGTFAAGSAWVKELSTGADAGSGARRAAISLPAASRPARSRPACSRSGRPRRRSCPTWRTSRSPPRRWSCCPARPTPSHGRR